jgi:hypothetical protein
MGQGKSESDYSSSEEDSNNGVPKKRNSLNLEEPDIP